MVHDFLVALSAVALLRLFDIGWPTKWWPWQVYACEFAVCFIVLTVWF